MAGAYNADGTREWLGWGRPGPTVDVMIDGKVYTEADLTAIVRAREEMKRLSRAQIEARESSEDAFRYR